LNAGHGKRVGSTARSHLVHRLLWSHVDHDFLVVIQDIRDGTVLTVLTLQMYRRDYEHNLTEGRIRKVVNTMVHAGLAPAHLWRPGVQGESVLVFAELKDARMPVPLGAWKDPVDSPDLARLGTQRDFWSWVADRLTLKACSVDDLLAVRARFSGGDLQDVPYACQQAAIAC
jgi:hypothetical protein